MRFDYENQMVVPAEAWLRSKGLIAKREFPTPWGICDLVGCSFNRHNVRKRLRLSQNKPIASYFRVLLLSQIPDEQDHPITPRRLAKTFSHFFDEVRIASELNRLEKDRFVRRTPCGSFYKINGWIPLHKKLIALELKLSRITDVLNQAVAHLEFADESFVGLPLPTAKRLLDSKRKGDFVATGVGILGVGSSGCRVLLRPDTSKSNQNAVIQMHCVERFWRTHLKDN
jgi:hypothetical protein